MKEQERSPERELNEMEASHLLDTEFKTMVLRMLKELKIRMDKFSKDIKR